MRPCGTRQNRYKPKASLHPSIAVAPEPSGFPVHDIEGNTVDLLRQRGRLLRNLAHFGVQLLSILQEFTELLCVQPCPLCCFETGRTLVVRVKRRSVGIILLERSRLETILLASSGDLRSIPVREEL